MKNITKFRPVLIPILLAVALLFSPQARTQDLTAEAGLDTTVVEMGGRLVLTLRLNQPTGITVQWPSIGDSLTVLSIDKAAFSAAAPDDSISARFAVMEVLDRSERDTSRANNRLLVTQKYLLTIFEAGSFGIPPFRFTGVSPESADTPADETEALLFDVPTVEVNLEEEIKDIKEPIDAPFSILEILHILIAVGLAVALIAAAILILKTRRKRPAGVAPRKPARPPHEIALEALRTLEKEKLWQEGKVKQYYTRLSEIARTYIEHRYDVLALESTTEEILAALRSRPDAHKPQLDKLHQALHLADMVKFAKAAPLPNEHELSIRNVYEYIQYTIPTESGETGKEAE